MLYIACASFSILNAILLSLLFLIVSYCPSGYGLPKHLDPVYTTLDEYLCRYTLRLHGATLFGRVLDHHVALIGRHSNQDPIATM